MLKSLTLSTDKEFRDLLFKSDFFKCRPKCLAINQRQKKSRDAFHRNLVNSSNITHSIS
jgi:hypothetical protein